MGIAFKIKRGTQQAGLPAVFSEFDERLRADMEIALERACSLLAKEQAERHDIRRLIAERLVTSARAGQTNLTALTAAARLAVNELLKK